MKRYIRWLSLGFFLQPIGAPAHGASSVPGHVSSSAAASPLGAPSAPSTGRAQQIPAPTTAVPDNYRLGPADVLLIRVARHEEMDAEVTVLDDGKIMVPRVGELQVSERTIPELQRLITVGLKKTLVDPDVSIVLKVPRPQLIYVSGSVRAPHGILMAAGWRVTEALAEAGGLIEKPERARATLFRRPNQMIRLDLARIYIAQDPNANVVLQPGDNIDVQEESTARVYVSGAVMHAGPVELPKDAGITEAIALAGGTTPLAALSRTQVQRLSGEKTNVDMEGVLNQGKPAPVIRLESGDQIIVPENHQRVAVLGWVKSPGAFPLPDGATLTAAGAVALAGGPDPRARSRAIGVIRMVNGQAKILPVDLQSLLKTGNSDKNPVLEDQDIVFVPETNRPDWNKILPGAQALGSLWYFLRL